MISGRRASAVLESPPGRTIAVGEILIATVGVGEISRSKNRSGNFIDQFCGGVCASKVVATGDIASADEGRIGRGDSRFTGGHY